MRFEFEVTYFDFCAKCLLEFFFIFNQLKQKSVFFLAKRRNYKQNKNTKAATKTNTNRNELKSSQIIFATVKLLMRSRT